MSGRRQARAAAGAPPPGTAAGGFVVALDAFEGPLDLLLDLARRQRIDLGRISILRLAEQYQAYLDTLRAGDDLPVAAEYLVMAAWLAFLKSQLLLPLPEREGPDPDAMGEALEKRLRLLDTIRRGAVLLAGRPRLGEGRLPRGLPEDHRGEVRTAYAPAGLAELFAAYGDVLRRRGPARMTFPARRLDTVEAAIQRLGSLLTGLDWRDLMSFLPREGRGPGDEVVRRSSVAASLVAGLELARSGAIELRQVAPFGPIMVRRR